MANPLRVLVIDDSMVARRQVQMALVDHTVEVAPSFAAGLDALRLNKPDVLLLDDSLTGHTLAECLHELRSEWSNASVPTVLLTDDDQLAIELLQQEYPFVVGFLGKPLAKEQISEAVQLATLANVGDVSANAPTADEIARTQEILASVLGRRFAAIPQWESKRNERDAQSYYLANLLPPAVIQSLAQHLTTAPNNAESAAVSERLPLAIFDQDVENVSEPLREWFARRYGVEGRLLVATTVFEDLQREPPQIFVCAAESVGLNQMASFVQQVVATCPTTKLVVTSALAAQAQHTQWQQAGAALILTKPFSLAAFAELLN